MRYLISTTETYRVASEEDVTNFIEEQKQQAKDEGYTLSKCTYTLKEKKKKGEIIDAGYLVSVQKTYATFWEID